MKFLRMISVLFCFFGHTFVLAENNVLLEEEGLKPSLNINPSDVIHWDFISGAHYKDGYIEVDFRLRTEQNFNIYATKLSILSSTDQPLVNTHSPKTVKIVDPMSGKEAEIYESGDFIFIFRQEGDKKDHTNFAMTVSYVGCSTKICLFPHQEVLNLQLSQNDENLPDILKEGMVQPAAKPEIASGFSFSNLQHDLALKLKSEQLSLWLLLLIAFLGGLLTNITPCVYPMIPITIRLLSKQSKAPFLGASFYALGIITTYTSLGIFASVTGSMFGNLMASNFFNYFLCIMMFLLGFSLLGFSDFAFIQNLGNKIQTKKFNLFNAFLMGIGVGFVASPCVGPILAALLTYIAGLNDLKSSVLILLCFSSGFSLPYIILGGASAKFSTKKISPQLQIISKLVFAAMMFALGFFYLKTPLYKHLSCLSPYWSHIALASVAVSLLLLFFQRKNILSISAKTIPILFCFILGISLFSLFEWSKEVPNSSTLGLSKLSWIENDEAGARKLAKESNANLIIDFWAEWCEACKKIETVTFTDPELIKYLIEKKFVLLRIDLTEVNDANDALQKKYLIGGLPHLAIFPKGGEITDAISIDGFVDGRSLLKKIEEIK